MSEAEVIRSLQQQIEQADPEALAQVMQEHPEWFKVVFNAQREFELIESARQDTVEGYIADYELTYGFKPPDHVVEMVRGIYKAHEDGEIFTLNGWRGCWKSVSLSAFFLGRRIGLEPHKTNVVIGANDDSTDKITKLVAQRIMFHPAWKKVFPNIVPADVGRWSVNGYWVIDKSMTDAEWAAKQAGVIDPTFVGGGYESTRINGKHPTGVLCVDDIHDINNSLSESESRKVVRAMTTVILKTAVREHDKYITWIWNIGVPWPYNDVHRTLKAAGAHWMEIPAMRRAAEGEPGAVYIEAKHPKTGIEMEDIKGWWTLTAPERFGVKSIIQERAIGKYEFWQMIMLDLTTAKAAGLRYYVYPHDKIDDNWPMRGGADPAATFKEKYEEARKNSHFALAYLAKKPMGGAVLKDGVLEICSPNSAAIYIAAAESLFPNWSFTAVENVGFGLMFKQFIQRINPALRIVASNLSGVVLQQGEKSAKVKSKHDRIQYELAPWFENATIMVSDADTPFLNAFRKLFDNFYEMDERVPDEAWDAGDSVYHAVKSMPEILQALPPGEELQSVFVRPKSKHPLSGMRARGYG